METNINSEMKLSSAADCEQHKTWMTSRQTVASEAALIRLFVGKQMCNITFAVDSSEKMRAALGSVKRLLIQTLLTKASLKGSLFNIVTFSAKLSLWSHHMLPCAPDTVYMALSWIHSISCSPGRDLMAALSIALTDPACHAVHVLCTDMPDQPEAVLTALPALAAGRPVNVFYLQDSVGQMDGSTRDYLQCLSQATGGSCYMIPLGLNGALEQVVPLCAAENRSSAPAVSKCCCPSSTALTSHNLCNTPASLLRCSLGNPPRPVTSCMLSGHTLGSPQFFPGCRVLARREMDVFYYLGTVIQQVQGCGGLWIVEFHHPAGLGAVSSQRQLVCSLDMVNHIASHTHCLAPGDTVLSPWEPDLRRYGPGRVMAATERRDAFGADGVSNIRVLMWDGCVSVVPGRLVSFISACHHDRIVRELQIPTSASGRCCWPRACSPRLSCTDCCQSSCCCCSDTNNQLCRFPSSCRSSFRGIDGFEEAQQRQPADLKDTEERKSDCEEHPSSSSSSASEGETCPSDGKVRREQQRPPWRYWRRTGPEPQHRQPGSRVPRRTSQPVRFSFPVPQISASPNHSSLFQSLPGSKGRRANIRDVFGMTNFRPRPPVGLRPFSGNSVPAVYT